MSAILKIRFTAGTSIQFACREACRLADKLDVAIEFSFNDVKMFVVPDTDPKKYVDKFMEEIMPEPTDAS